ncbi:MAG: DUF1540 domain-containing protein [Syntrophomonadaceae bacterium]|nr:DUF1540 domain-containing protein [Syntrophomonadaceae bacterium]MDD3888532.1 DUF1540 domain-containing protein [Syntrophomonadaceae bacterium]MDD4548625.1 DUF1540 domain-containing protein [Syntrophomonadaceae bacterium]
MATTDLACKVKSCSFHHPDDRCAAGEIQVILNSQDAICDTFVGRDTDTKPAGNAKQEVPLEIRSARMADDARSVNLGNVGHLYEGDATNLEPLVSCNAENCTHNKHGVCFADQVTIDGDAAFVSGDTVCRMYSPS